MDLVWPSLMTKRNFENSEVNVDVFLSIVIPTIGNRHSLAACIDCVAGISETIEIIIVIPSDRIGTLSKLSLPPSAVVVETPFWGQVAQRQAGIERARGIYLLQLDDDYVFSKQAITFLLKKIEGLPEKSYLSPVVISQRKSGRLVNKKNGSGRLLLKTFPRPLPNTNINSAVPIQVDWLPGGFVLSKRDTGAPKNFYPFEGKAVDEDILQSIVRKKHGYSHFVARDIEVFTDFNDELSLPLNFDFRIKKYCYMLNSSNLMPFFLLYSFKVASRAVRKVINPC